MTRLTERLDRRLAPVDTRLADHYPGDPGTRQPVHTVYVPADRLDADTVSDWSTRALEAARTYADGPADMAEVSGLERAVVEAVWPRVLAKLEQGPIEDLRIDLEDGYGVRSDADEDAAALAAARALVGCLDGGGPKPTYYGVRFKSFEAPTRRRGLRSLALFVGEFAASRPQRGALVLTLPKVTSVEQVEAMVLTCEVLESEHRLDRGTLRFEIQVETPQSILGADGTAPIARMIRAAEGRCTGMHYGTYDYSASCGIVAAYQSMDHPAADHAKAVMQVAAAGTGVFLSDGSTNVLPVGDRSQVHAAWALHARLVRRSLERGYYQGWDLHPAQLPTRYLATYAFYRQGLPDASGRLRAYVDASGGSAILDEPATAAALAAFVLRGIQCGATDEAEVAELSGVDRSTLVVLARHRREPEANA